MSALYTEMFNRLQDANPVITWAAREIVAKDGDTAALTEAKIAEWSAGDGKTSSDEIANALRFAVEYLKGQ